MVTNSMCFSPLALVDIYEAERWPIKIDENFVGKSREMW
jgi:hypothetical protein